MVSSHVEDDAPQTQFVPALSMPMPSISKEHQAEPSVCSADPNCTSRAGRAGAAASAAPAAAAAADDVDDHGNSNCDVVDDIGMAFVRC